MNYQTRLARFHFIQNAKKEGQTWEKIAGALNLKKSGAKDWYRGWEYFFSNINVAEKMTKSSRILEAEIKQEMRELGFPKAPGVAWPQSLRDKVLQYLAQSGLSRGAVAFELGIHNPTLRSWVRRAQREKHEIKVPVELKQEMIPPAPVCAETATVVAPNGIRIEGLTLRSVAELLKHLEA